MEELRLIKTGNVQITPSGSLYVEKLSDTLHRVKKYRLSLIDGSTRELTFKEYSVISEGITKTNAKFTKLRDGELIAISQIRSIKPYEVIVDTRRDNL